MLSLTQYVNTQVSCAMSSPNKCSGQYATALCPLLSTSNSLAIGVSKARMSQRCDCISFYSHAEIVVQ
uniref:Uncharacterized protein n=1 Tax=Arion vulgaris TaxID=1028688 RepID=A0A0B7A7B7_9EUPU